MEKKTDKNSPFVSVLRGLAKLPFKVSRRERKILVLGAVVGALILLYMYRVEPVLSEQQEAKKQIIQREKLLSGSQKRAKEKAPLQRDLSAVRTKLKEMEGGLLEGDNPSLAAASLQEIIREISGKTGIAVTSVRVLPPVPLDRYTEIPVRIETTGKISALKDLLYEIETWPKLMMIKEMNVYVFNFGPARRPVSAGPMPGRGDPRSRVPRMAAPRPVTDFRTGLVISGLIKSSEKPRASKSETTKSGAPKRELLDAEQGES
ncbi:MAG: type II secretion system protein GspM [Pseudomonadota bacterium]